MDELFPQTTVGIPQEGKEACAGDLNRPVRGSIMHAEDAALIAKNMLAELAAPHLIDHHELHISASIGIGIDPDHGEDAETLLQSADSAMYHSKESGRSNYKFFEHAMNTHAVRRQSIEASLRRAMERQEFVFHYQPKIDLLTQRITGAEALIRWQQFRKRRKRLQLFIASGSFIV